MGGIADDDRLRRSQWLAIDQGAPLEGDERQLSPIGGVRAVAAEGEETVESRAMKLDVGRGLDVSGYQTQQVAVVDQTRKQFRHAGQHPVVLSLGDGPVQVVQPALEQTRELLALGLSMQHRLEGLASNVGVGHPGVGELTDVSRDAVQLVESQSPRRSPRTAGDEQRPVDVKQDGDTLVCHISGKSTTRGARRWGAPARSHAGPAEIPSRVAQSEIRSPMITVRSSGSLKYLTGLAALWDIVRNSLLRQPLMPGVCVCTIVICDRK